MNLVLIILLFTVLFGLTGALLGFSAHHFKVVESPVAGKLNDVLPQTQCGQCGYAGCKQYAEAMAKNEAGIDLCVPGGQSTIDALAAILNIPAVKAQQDSDLRAVAFIEENLCIGCSKCSNSCPVDAIVGASKMIHTVIGNRCTSCRLCETTCPTGCISMIKVPKRPDEWNFCYPSLKEQFDNDGKPELEN
jgi:electron transport complex protein RnfB